MRPSPRLVAIAISTARMFRLASADLASFRPPAWVKQSSSSFSSLASDGMSSAGSGGTTRWSSPSRRIVPRSPGGESARVDSSPLLRAFSR
jgi:hypothetical protein